MLLQPIRFSWMSLVRGKVRTEALPSPAQRRLASITLLVSSLSALDQRLVSWSLPPLSLCRVSSVDGDGPIMSLISPVRPGR